MVQYAVFIAEIRLLELSGLSFVEKMEGHPGVYHRLALQHVHIIFSADIYICEHLQVRLPVEKGAGVLFLIWLLSKAPYVLAVLKVQGVFISVPAHLHVHIFRGVLGGAEAQAIESQGVFVVLPGVVIVFASGVQLAEDQLPVIAFFFSVVVHGAATAVVLHLYGLV